MHRSAITLLAFLLAACAGAAVRDGAVPMPSAHGIERVLLVCDEPAPGVADARRPALATVAALDGTELWHGEVRVRRSVDAATAGALTGGAIGERLQLWRDDWPFGMVRGFDFD